MIITALLGLALSLAFTGAPVSAAQAADPDPRLAAAIFEWFDKGGQQHSFTLADDFTAISKAADKEDFSGMRDACIKLDKDVAAASRYAPLPDAQAQKSWAAALQHYDLGATHCVHATEALDAELMVKAAKEFQLGGEQVTTLTTRVEEIVS